MKNVLLLLISLTALTSCTEEVIEYVDVPGETIIEYVEVIEYVTEAGAILDANLVGKFVRQNKAYVFNYDGSYKLYVDGVITNSGDWRVDITKMELILNDGQREYPFVYKFNNRNRLRLDGRLWRRRLI